MACGLIISLCARMFCWLAQRRFRLWLYADRYETAELEVSRFIDQSRDSDARSQIEGVIHPGGQPVVTTDEHIAIRQFDGPEDKRGHRPSPSEIEGKRLPVSYWPRRAGLERWWHPPTVVSRGEIPEGGTVLRNALNSGALVALGVFCFRRGIRQVRIALNSASGSGTKNVSHSTGSIPVP